MTDIKSLAALAFNTLENRSIGVSKLSLSQLCSLDAASVSLPGSSPLFVTWNKKGHLRGCIGTFEAPQSLEIGVRSYAEIAGFEDPRFPAIKSSEIPKLEVAVTLLGPLEPITDSHDWTIGVHGVKAKFPGGYSSVYLPEVAEEQGWDHDETIESLANKAGAPSTRGVKLWRYEGIKSILSYKEYKQLVDGLQ